MVVINCFSGGNFLNVETAEATIINASTNNPMKNILIGCKGNHTALLFCLFFRDETKPNSWRIKEIGKCANGSTFQDVENDMKRELRFLIPEDLENEMQWDSSSKKSFDMKKGDVVRLRGLKKVVMGLGWDTRCDLDASVIEIRNDMKVGEVIYFSHRQNKNRSILHSGDNTTGEGEGDDETITVHLEKVPSEVFFMIFIVNVYTNRKTFGDVKGAYCRLMSESGIGRERSTQEVCKYNLSDRESGEGMVMSLVYRAGPSDWKIKAVGREVSGRTADKSREETVEVLKEECNFGRVRQGIERGMAEVEARIMQMEGELETYSVPVVVPNMISMKCRAEHVDKLDVFGKSDPYYLLKTGAGDELYRSEIKMVTLDPDWKEAKIKDIDMNTVYTIECFDWDKHSSDDLIGTFPFIPSQASDMKRYEIINEQKKKKKKEKYKNSGVFVIETFCKEVTEKNPMYEPKMKMIHEEKKKYEEMKKTLLSMK